jgi:hypothetical protein
LTRRANHRHTDINRKNFEARARNGGGFFHFLKSGGGAA